MYLLSRKSIPLRNVPRLKAVYSSRITMSSTPTYKYISAEVREFMTCLVAVTERIGIGGNDQVEICE
jgi:hypothetical protein